MIPDNILSATTSKPGITMVDIAGTITAVVPDSMDPTVADIKEMLKNIPGNAVVKVVKIESRVKGDITAEEKIISISYTIKQDVCPSLTEPVPRSTNNSTVQISKAIRNTI